MLSIAITVTLYFYQSLYHGLPVGIGITIIIIVISGSCMQWHQH